MKNYGMTLDVSFKAENDDAAEEIASSLRNSLKNTVSVEAEIVDGPEEMEDQEEAEA